MSFTPGAGTRFLVTSTTSGTTLSGPLSITGGTATTNTPVLSATQTWNNAAVTFTGWQLNVTDTASNAASLLMDLQRNGVSFFNVTKVANGTLNINTNNTVTIGDGYIRTRVGASNGFDLAFNGLSLGEQTPLIFKQVANGITYSSLFSTASGTIEQRNGVNAQTFRLYNTYTDASNYERGGLSWSSNELVFFTGNAGTGLARNISIVSAAGINVSAPTSQIGFSTNGLSRWNVANAGHLLAASDNTVDIGASGANRPRNLFIAGSATIGGDATVSGGSGLAVTSGPAVLVGSNARVELVEVTAPAAPAANRVRIYAVDNGSGKTQLMALFATGAAQQIAIEP